MKNGRLIARLIGGSLFLGTLGSLIRRNQKKKRTRQAANRIMMDVTSLAPFYMMFSRKHAEGYGFRAAGGSQEVCFNCKSLKDGVCRKFDFYPPGEGENHKCDEWNS